MLTYLEAWTLFLSLVLQKMCEQKLHPLSYTDDDMDSQCQQDQHKSQYVPHIICDSGLGAKMSVLFACLIKRVSKLPLYQLVIILSSADVLCKQFGRPPVKYFTDRPKAVLLLWIFYVFSVFRLLCLCAGLFMCALWSPAEKGLTSWALVCGVRLWVCHFPIGILGQVWYLIVSIPDLCTHIYFNTGVARAHDEKCL